MSSVKQVPHLQDYSEFERSQFGFCASYSEFLERFQDVHPTILQKLDDNIETCIHVITCLEIDFFIEEFSPVNLLNFYSLDERLGTWFSSTVFSIRQPFAERFEMISSRITESGIWGQWVFRKFDILYSVAAPPFELLKFDDLISMSTSSCYLVAPAILTF